MRQRRFSKGSDVSQEPIALITVGSYWSPIDAWMARNRLAGEGIDAFVNDEFVASTCWIYANAIGGIKVQVPAGQVAAAHEVLACGKSNVFVLVRTIPQSENQQVCQDCGSPELYRERFDTRLVFLLWLVLGIPFPVPSSAVECYDCGAREGPPTSFKLQFGIRHLLALMFIVAIVLGIMRLTGHTWFDAAANPSRDWLQ